MDKRDVGLEYLCKLYLDLNDDYKDKIIKLGEGLLNSQRNIEIEKSIIDRLNHEALTN